jgi:uncharacterized membrane protein
LNQDSRVAWSGATRLFYFKPVNGGIAMKHLSRCILALVAISLLAGANPAYSTSFTFTSFDYPGATQTEAWGINNFGNIVGSYHDAMGNDYGFLKVGDTYTQIAYPPTGSTKNFAYGINASGAIVGQYSVISSKTIDGFLKVGDTYTDIAYPGLTGFGKTTQAWGINNSDEIVGIYGDETGTYGFLKVGDTYTQIAYPGAARTLAHGINDPGVIVGFYDDGAIMHGFIATPVPLPSTLLFLSSGLLGLAGWRYRGRRS